MQKPYKFHLKYAKIIYNYIIKEETLMPDKILVVDDEAEIADLVELYLTNENFLVYKFYSANDALECIKNEQLDLAILDRKSVV